MVTHSRVLSSEDLADDISMLCAIFASGITPGGDMASYRSLEGDTTLLVDGSMGTKRPGGRVWLYDGPTLDVLEVESPESEPELLSESESRGPGLGNV